MNKAIKTDGAPAAIGPYSQAVKTKSGQLIFCSGQIPLDPATMRIVGDTAAQQCRQVLNNLTAVLAAASAGLSDVVKTTVYLADMNDFAAVNEVYGEFFPNDPPARAAIQAARLPKDVRIQIEAIAVV
jgi:2-iminobutanoate/2-iminopropanoate deaminase